MPAWLHVLQLRANDTGLSSALSDPDSAELLLLQLREQLKDNKLVTNPVIINNLMRSSCSGSVSSSVSQEESTLKARSYIT